MKCYSLPVPFKNEGGGERGFNTFLPLKRGGGGGALW